MASYNELQFDMEILLENIGGHNNSNVDLQLAAELGKTLLERNKELENLLRAHQRKCEDQKQEIEYLTKQNIALKEVNDSRMQIYETLDVSIRDLEIEKHGLLVQTSSDKKLIKNLKQNIESLEQRCDEISKQVEDLTQTLEAEKRKNIRLRENSSITHSTTTNHYAIESPIVLKSITADNNKNSHNSSANEPEHEEVCTPTNNPSKSFTGCGHLNISPQIPFSYSQSQDFSSIQPIYSLESHDSGFKTECGSSSAENDEILKLMSRLEDADKQLSEERNKCIMLEDELAALSRENHELRSQIAKVNTVDDMKSIHEELSILEEVRQGQLCTRCLKAYDSRMVPTENNSFIGTEVDDDEDQSIKEFNDCKIYRSAVTIKDDETSSQNSDVSNDNTYNPYKDLVEKYEKLLEVKRSAVNRQSTQPQQSQQPMSLHDELMVSGEFNVKFSTTSDEKTKESNEQRHKTPTDFSEVETTSSGFSDETSTKATQTEASNGTFSFSIAEGDDCKFTIYDNAAPTENRFCDRPKYRELFTEIFSVLKKAAENKEDGKKLPLLDDKDKQSEIAETPSIAEITADFDDQSIMSSLMSEDSVAISECITKTERKKAISHKKQAIKDGGGSENKPPSAVQMVGGNLVTPYNRIALDFDALMAKKRTRRGRRRSKDKQTGRDSSICSNASSSISNVARETIHEDETGDLEAGDQSTLTRSGKKGGKRINSEIYQTLTTQNVAVASGSDWNGDSMTVYNRKMKSRNPSNYFCRPPTTNDNSDNTSEIEFKHSAAHSELRKLKKLDKSYAEVLKVADRRYRRWK